MDIFSYVANNVKYYYNTMNSATLTGAIDVIVVEQPDGSLQSTPFHVRFGKYGVFNSDEKYVDITINKEEIKGLKMKLAENGVAYFVQETEDAEVPAYLASSPVPGSPIVGDSALEENVRKLKRQQQREETRARREKRRLPGTDSRSPSPTSRSGEDKTPEATPSTAAADNHSPTDPDAKKKIAMSSSIFSNRRYRSLPDLSNIGNVEQQKITVAPPIIKRHSRKLTAGNISSKDVQATVNSIPTPQSPRSLSMSKFPRNSDRQISTKDFMFPKQGNESSEGKEVKTEPTTPVKTVNFAPSPSASSDSDSDTSKADDAFRASPSPDEKPAAASLPKKPSAANLDIIGDGALSDSEVDRSRNQAPTDNAVWNWGEFPDSSKQAKKSDSYWSWLPWSRRSEQPKELKNEGVYLDDLVSSKNEDELEKYLGKRSAGSTISSVADSGNGHSVLTPMSTAALSCESLNSEVTQGPANVATPTADDVKTALEKDQAVEQELLAGTDEHSTHPQTKLGEKLKQRQKSGNSVTSVSEGSYMSDEDAVPMRRTRYVRSLRLSSDELKSLNLQYGSNEVRFSVTTKFQGTSWCSCHIYLFRYYEKLVISDIDGTITKSDVLGHVIAAIGGQWAHTGVAELYTRIKDNGYKMVYLSSRAIGQSHYTKTYLQSLAQGSRSLPDGPVLLSPMSVLMAFRKEVIERKPEEFKIACLTDLKDLFPCKHPFYAGFGNRDTDVKSYTAVSIPPERIMIINPSGTVKRADQAGFVSSYVSIAMDTVDYLFPPLHRSERKSSSVCEEAVVKEKMVANFTKPETCSTFTLWRNKPDDFAMVDDELAAYEKKRKEMADANKKKAKKSRK